MTSLCGDLTSQVCRFSQCMASLSRNLASERFAGAFGQSVCVCLSLSFLLGVVVKVR